MRIPEWFEVWYKDRGVDSDYLPWSYWRKGLRIAWRVYRKGRKDMKNEMDK